MQVLMKQMREEFFVESPLMESVTLNDQKADHAERRRCTWHRSATKTAHKAFAEDVRRGLGESPKSIPSRRLYDTLGSQLFEQICKLPEYYLTRAETEILRSRADELAGLFDDDVTLVELGSGNSEKTCLLIDAFFSRQTELRYVPVDISRGALEQSSGKLLRQYPGLKVAALACDYEEAMERLNEVSDSPRLILWLGSSIGNLDRPDAAEFLRNMMQHLSAKDQFLIGIDLRKDAAVLEAAYDDAQGVTAAFSLNLLKRINRELGGHFDLGTFQHRARYDETQGRIEIDLVSQKAQKIRIDSLELEVDFAEGESIETEHCVKYSLDEINSLAAEAGLSVRRQFMDRRSRFSLNVLEFARE